MPNFKTKYISRHENIHIILSSSTCHPPRILGTAIVVSLDKPFKNNIAIVVSKEPQQELPLSNFKKESSFSFLNPLASSQSLPTGSEKIVTFRSWMQDGWIITSRGWMQDGMNFCSLGTPPLLLANGWGLGGKTEVNLKAAIYDKCTGQ